MPLVSKTFDQLLDFTRTSSATFVGSNGLIQNTAASRNLLLQTQQFDNAAWLKTAATVTANTTVAPDSTSTADKLVATATTTFHGTSQTVTGTVASYTYSVYAKAAEYSKLQLANGSAGTWSATFDLATGATIATGGTAVLSSSIQSVGDGWYRCAVTFTGAAASTAHSAAGYPNTGATLNNFGASYTGDGTSGIYVWGAQLEAAAAATTYTRNNGGVFPPRFDYDPVTLAPKGLLIEEQRTNLLLYSEQFDNAAWAKSNVTLTANAAVSPDGSTTADLIVDPATAAQHLFSQSFNVVSGTAYTASFYAKNNGHGQCVYTWSTGNSAFASSNVTFNLLTGVATVVGAGSATMTAVGNGWYRCTATNTATATVIGTAYYLSLNGLSSYTGSGTGGAYFWGAQLEAGAFATSYIPTVASQVTRTADQCSIVAPNFASWYNQSAGTFVFEGTVLGSTGFSWPLVASDNTAANRLAMYRSGASVAGFIATSSATQMEITSSSVVVNVPFKIAVSAQANDGNFSFNGNIGTTDTSITMPIVNRLSLGASASGSAEYFNGHIRSIRYYPTRLTNVQLQALTA